jgi:flagellar motor switch protein FliN/FliY
LSVSHKFNLGKDTISVNQYSWSKSTSDDDSVDVSRAEFDSFSSENGANGNPRNINMLLDVELEVLVELGRKSMKIRDVLKLGKGSLIELNKAAGEPLTIYVNNRKLAEGEVVVVDDNFGIRITKLASPKERIKSLG